MIVCEESKVPLENLLLQMIQVEHVCEILLCTKELIEVTYKYVFLKYTFERHNFGQI